MLTWKNVSTSVESVTLSLNIWKVRSLRFYFTYGSLTFKILLNMLRYNFSIFVFFLLYRMLKYSEIKYVIQVLKFLTFIIHNNTTIIFLAVPCGMRDLSYVTRDHTIPLAMEVWSLNYWTASKVPSLS